MPVEEDKGKKKIEKSESINIKCGNYDKAKITARAISDKDESERVLKDVERRCTMCFKEKTYYRKACYGSLVPKFKVAQKKMELKRKRAREKREISDTALRDKDEKKKRDKERKETDGLPELEVIDDAD